MTATKQPSRAEQLQRADDRRVRILQIITDYLTPGAELYKGYPPTVSELAGLVAVSSKQVRTDLAALESAGLIERDPGRASGIRIVTQS